MENLHLVGIHFIYHSGHLVYDPNIFKYTVHIKSIIQQEFVFKQPTIKQN